jgi:MinD-like ATPase involved in chromosome partitioning or flagellar assembly
VDAGTMPPVVTFFSHKGGVGRSTALVATALHLARSNRKVAVVDLDIEAPGLSSLLLASPPSVGGLDYLVEASVGVGSTARDVTAYVADADFVGSGPGLQVVPAGPVDDAFLEMLARIDLQDAGASSILAARILQLFRELQSQFGPLDFILVDARAGLHEVAGLMLAGLCHGAVVVGTDSPQSWIGITQVAQLLSAPYRREGKDPRPVLLVHGMAPAASDPRYESETRSFRTRAYDELSRFYYPTDQVPSEGERDRPHWPVVVPWTAELRGGGGLLTAPVVSALMSSPYRELTERLARLFGRPLDARGNS